MSDGVVEGDGYSLANLDDLGDGPGFRKIRTELGVTAFGINAIVLPPGLETGFHYHEKQEETYFLHRGEIEIEFGDGTAHRLRPGGVARVAASTPRKIRNPGSEDAVYVVAGGKDGYVGRDGVMPEGETGRVGPIGGSSASSPGSGS